MSPVEATPLEPAPTSAPGRPAPPADDAPRRPGWRRAAAAALEAATDGATAGVLF